MTRRFFLTLLGTVSATLAPGAAWAAKTPPALAACATTDITAALGTVTACQGFISGNVLNSSHIQAQEDALSALGFDWDGHFNNVVKVDLKGSHTLDFHETLTGISYLAVHYGNGAGGPGNGTAFYVLDAAQGINQLHLAYNASSDAVLYVTALPTHDTGVSGVPEPATWATMIGGFGAIGAQMRRRRRNVAAA
jgi:hypothetical protein